MARRESSAQPLLSDASMSARWGYEVKVDSDAGRGYRDARVRTVVRRSIPGVVRASSARCIWEALLLRTPQLIIAFAILRFALGLGAGWDDPSAIALPILLVAPGGLLVVGMITTSVFLHLRLPYAPCVARITKTWLRLHQVLVSVALPATVGVLDGPGLAFFALAVSLAISRVVWCWSAELGVAALAIEELDAQSG